MENDLGIRAIEPGELELFVTTAEPSKIDLIGSKGWVEWHNRFQILQQQAVLEAASLQEEVTRDAIISYGKIPILVHEAICISIWRQKIFPKILELDPEISHTFLLYAVLYHETVAVGLLEVVLFDEEACCAISDILVDLVDYCAEMVTSVIGLVNSGYLQDKSTDANPNPNIIKELLSQQKDLQFDIAMRCLTIISILANALNAIHISASGRLYETHDTPLLLAELLHMEPWQRRDADGNILQYIDGKWKKQNPDDAEKMCRAETMCWLALWRLLLNPDLHNHYEINNTRKTEFCKLLYKITDPRMDQLPVLNGLKRSLGQLAMTDTTAGQASASRPLLMEVMPQIKPSIIKRINKKSKAIAKSQLQYFFKPDKMELMELAKVLSSSYTSEVLEHMDDGGAKCAVCGERAAKKCSRCRNEWYCGRECQVKKWPKHKDICDQFSLIVN